MSNKNEHGLTPQQERFAQEVARGKSLSDAYRAAYKVDKMKPEVIHVKASELAAIGTISVRCRQLQAEAADDAKLDAIEIAREIRRIALSDIKGIMTEDGKLRLPHELDPATRAAVASFEIDEYGRIKYKFWDKNSALERAAKILGMFEKDHQQAADAVVAAFARSMTGNVVGVSA